MRTLAITTAALIGTAGIAHAGSLADAVATPAPQPVAPAPVVLDPSWTGFYAGGQIVTGDVEVGDADADADGFGVHAGYLYDLGTVVVGGEIDYDDLDVDGFDDASVARLKGIAGYNAGSFLPYVTAGVAQLDVDNGVDSVDDTGAFYGLGLAYAANENIRVSGEYLEHQFDDFNDGGADVDASTVSLRVSFAF
ncbi:porin family protein [Salipiger sp. IMCC34102]|uniref:outer membrane protein n=1 Tax=Salipiger sp. IMCC34102 TaxID=2510647 RepID=UPI00101E0D42|nr:outer membrane beta-barrel protein [Salipiger sp. IMCC34102]RYH03465.1 porin family protein [Salipiger sp. IMCC34102]